MENKLSGYPHEGTTDQFTDSVGECPSVIISVLNWNGLDDTRECLRSLLEIEYPQYEIVVVDNDSRENEAETLRREFNEEITVIRTQENRGFAGGHNVSIRYALSQRNADYVLLLNNDATVEKTFLQQLVQPVHSRPDVAAASPLLLRYSDRETVWSAGIFKEAPWRPFENMFVGQPKSAVPARPFEVDSVIGCALLLRSTVLREIGLLDEIFFLQHEESDWCRRAQKQGYTCLVIPEAEVYHKISQSVGTGKLSAFYDTRNRIIYTKKHESTWVLPVLILQIVNHYRTEIFSTDSIRKALLEGIYDGMLSAPPRYVPA